MRRLIGISSLVLAMLAPTVSPVHAAPAPPPYLEGERLTGEGTATSAQCPVPGNTFAYTVSGAATGLYPGTFTEQGTVQNYWEHSVTFSITADDGTTVSGTKQMPGGQAQIMCSSVWIFERYNLSYTATITTPTGSYQDEGTVNHRVTYYPDTGRVTVVETFDSALFSAPTSKAQCKNGGWKNYPQFKSQGECEAYVNRYYP